MSISKGMLAVSAASLGVSAQPDEEEMEEEEGSPESNKMHNKQFEQINEELDEIKGNE
jgi:hypothetical protein